MKSLSLGRGVSVRRGRPRRTFGPAVAEPVQPEPSPIVAAAPGGADVPTPEQRARRAGGPEDRALYTCSCGAAFHADVQVDVPCPACGATQSW